MECHFYKYYFIIKFILGFVALFGVINAAKDSKRKYPMLMPDVRPLIKESYLCTAFRMPQSDFQYITEFTPNASMQTAHHILIYGCDLPGKWERDTPRLVWDCGEMSNQKTGFSTAPTCFSGSQIIYAWAKDAPPLHLPSGVGFRVGKDTGINFLVLQVHYANVDKFIDGSTDNSGIILTLLPSSTDKVTKTAGVYLLGTSGIIPPKSAEHMESSCKMEEALVLHPFGFRTHTHALGKVVSGYKIDKQGKWYLIGKHDPQKPQMFYPVENKTMTIEYGDILAARCTMQNHRSRTTYIGSTADDEMCNFYMMYYVDGDRPMKEKYCFTMGPPGYYWNGDPRIGIVPQSIEKSASQLD